MRFVDLLVFSTHIYYSTMNTLTIDDTKFVVLEQHEYEKLLERAASKRTPARKMTLQAGKKMAYRLIDKWSRGR